MHLPATNKRVPAHTAERINQRIDQQIAANVAYYADNPQRIDQRLRELDREWDIERVLETNASSLALLGTVLGACVDRRFLLLPAVVSGFLLQHALQGWCPPLSLLRRRGIRTTAEIERERYSLKAVRGDLDTAHVQPPGHAPSVVGADSASS